MKKLILTTMTLLMFSAPAFAHTMSFECGTTAGLEKGLKRTISFTLDFSKGSDRGTIVRVGEKDPFVISPFSDALRALNTFDNASVVLSGDRIQVDADEIGMYHTTLVLWKNRSFKMGYVATSGESNVKMYSPITCR